METVLPPEIHPVGKEKTGSRPWQTGFPDLTDCRKFITFPSRTILEWDDQGQAPWGLRQHLADDGGALAAFYSTHFGSREVKQRSELS
jgi:hypothetical protein